MCREKERQEEEERRLQQEEEDCCREEEERKRKAEAESKRQSEAESKRQLEAESKKQSELESKKQSQASNAEKAKKEEGGKKFGGGMRGLRDLSRGKDPEEEKKVGTRKLEGQRLIKRDQLDIITEYIASQMPYTEEQIQMELERIPFNSDTVSFLFQEYLRMKIFFLFDYMDTIKMNESLEKMIKNNKEDH